MNQFNTLDAQAAESAYAKMTPDEFAEYQAEYNNYLDELKAAYERELEDPGVKQALLNLEPEPTLDLAGID